MLNRKLMWFKRFAAWGILAVFCVNMCVYSVGAEESETAETQTGESITDDVLSYAAYREQYQDAARPASEMVIDVQNVVSVQEQTAAKAEYDDRQGILVGQDNGWSEWEFTVSEEGVYHLNLSYYPVKGNGQDIVLSLLLDGKSPYAEAEALSLPRIWADKADENGNTIQQDVSGNDIKPQQVEKPRWISRWLTDGLGIYDEPLLFYLSAGTHTIRLAAEREAAAISTITFAQKKNAPSYDDYLQQYSGKNVEGAIYKIEAERAFEKSSSMLAPDYDAADANMSPASEPGKIRMTAIGEENWIQTGQFLSWIVPEDLEPGLYQMDFRARQGTNPGLASYRALYVNGELPFAEASAIDFPYRSEWYIKTFGDDAPYYVYLEPGDIITLEATTGPTGEILKAVNQLVLDLNATYRQIIGITGTTPDVYRDYSLDKEIPTLKDDLKAQQEQVEKLSAMIKEVTGSTTSHTATLDQMAVLMDSMRRQPNMIPESLSNFKGSIDGIASIILSFNQQPLSLDVIYLRSADIERPKADAGFLNTLIFGLKRFFYSFSSDYDNMRESGSYDTVISVWALAGRDQSQVLSRLIQDQFSPQENIGVELSFVSSESILLQAILAGRGPDATVLGTKPETPINLAVRGAVVNLADPKYGLTQEFKDQFYPSAWEPFTYRDGIYAIPETQDFNVMFYRTDILDQLGLEIPQTWDEFYDVVKVLQNNNYIFGIQEVASDVSDAGQPGISASIGVFDAFLFQNGGTYFEGDKTQTSFNTPAAYDAFDRWVELYKEYGFSRSFDFVSMFRSGEMPIGISALVRTYGRIAATAPELQGLWTFAPIPGTLQEDGTIDRSESSESVGCMMHQAAVDRGVDQETFRFLTWWTGAEAQTEFALNLEASLGISGRRAVANKEAAARLGWSAEEKQVIDDQIQWVRGITQVPGSYILKRSLSSAMRRSVDMGEDSRRMLTVYNQTINDELKRKTEEFH